VTGRDLCSAEFHSMLACMERRWGEKLELAGVG
jgi:hypothetical protein